MTDPSVAVLLTSAGALGLSGSLHCGLMCGPLACAAGAGVPERERWKAQAGWNVGRVLAYVVVGAVLGGLGRGALGSVRLHIYPVLPWVLVAGLVLSALPWGLHLPRLPGGTRFVRALADLGAKFSPLGRGALLGAATPLLPCGLMYGAFLAALGTGSAMLGALWMGVFALAAVPVLGAAQALAQRLRRGPVYSQWALRAVPLLAAGVVAWRALQSGPPACH